MRRIGRTEDDYEPQKKCVPILDAAIAHINSVPYKVTLRWVFYRLLQDGFYRRKEDYSPFRRLQAQARKHFYNGWRPDTFADDTREFIDQGNGWRNVDEWLEAVSQAEYKETIWNSQKYYIEIWFEAGAMVAQFKYYAPEVPLFSFHGDCSIAPKWEAAKRLEGASQEYELPIVIFYFGDEDEKGLMIPESAAQDIKKWCAVPFEFIRAGLNLGDGKRLGLQESIDKPGAYQWEALSDAQAEDLIETALSNYFDFDAIDNLRDSDKHTSDKFQERMKDFIRAWGNK